MGRHKDPGAGLRMVLKGFEHIAKCGVALEPEHRELMEATRQALSEATLGEKKTPAAAAKTAERVEKAPPAKAIRLDEAIGKHQEVYLTTIHRQTKDIFMFPVIAMQVGPKMCHVVAYTLERAKALTERGIDVHRTHRFKTTVTKSRGRASD